MRKKQKKIVTRQMDKRMQRMQSNLKKALSLYLVDFKRVRRLAE